MQLGSLKLVEMWFYMYHNGTQIHPEDVVIAISLII
jgi:hypothetical protein